LRSDSIVLARVIEENVNENIEKDKIKDVVYKFELIENIKGNVEKPIIINGYNISNDNDHNLHAEPKFWEQGWFGSAPISVNCEMMIGFNPDISYLLFLDKPYSVKSFEPILDLKEDKWLQYVRDKVKEQAAND
jgi:hypothetical protein